MSDVKVFSAVVASDLALMHTGVRGLLSGSQRIQLVGATPRTPELLRLIRKKTPDLLIIEVDASACRTEQLVQLCRCEASSLKVLVLEGCHDSEVCEPVKINAAHGHFDRTCAPAQLLDACIAVCEGRSWPESTRVLCA